MNKSQTLNTLNGTTGPKPIFNANSMYRSWGQYLLAMEQYEKAKEAFDQAYDNNPDDVKTLVGRSVACSHTFRPQQAYEDAHKAFSMELKNPTVCKAKARALYSQAKFEHSLLINYQGYEIRRQPQCFRRGIGYDLETLKDTIGANAGQVLLKNLTLIKQMKEQDAPETRLRVPRMPKPEQKETTGPSEPRKHRAISRLLAKKYLGPMATEKFFLEKLLDDPRLLSANSAGSFKLKKTVHEALGALASGQEFLRTLRPYYSIKFYEKNSKKCMEKSNMDLLLRKRKLAANIAERLLRSVIACKDQKRIQDLISQADRMQRYLDRKALIIIPDKEKYTDRLYRTVGEGYLSQYRSGNSKQDDRHLVRFLMGFPITRSLSNDPVIRNYPFKYHDIEPEIRKITRDIESCENGLMRCWLYFELARLVRSQRKYELAKFYGRCCQHESEQVSSPTWWMNGCLVVMSGDMLKGNVQEVHTTAEDALLCVAKLPCHLRLQVKVFIRKCVEIASDGLKIDDDSISIKQRENNILRTMEDPQRSELQVLFKRMSRIPSRRRFCVMPRPPKLLDIRSERRSCYQHGLTIVPGETTIMRSPPRSSVLGFQLFDET